MIRYNLHRHSRQVASLTLLLVLSMPIHALRLTEALKNKQVKASFSGAEGKSEAGSSHWGPCITAVFTNLTGSSLTLSIDYGYFLMPTDSSIQRMIVTRQEVVALKSGEQKTYPLYAMCSEAHDAAPGSGTRFSLGVRAREEWVGLCRILSDKGYQNQTGQSAVWCLTDNYSLSEIYSEDTAMMNTLLRYVAGVKKIDLGKYNAESVKEYVPSREVRTTYQYSGELSYQVIKPTKTMIAMFDEAGHFVKVFVNNEIQREGTYKYNYAISGEEMKNKKCYLRLFLDGKMEEEITLLPRE